MDNGVFYKSKFFKFSCYILLTLLIIFMFGKINFFLSPLWSFVNSIIFPLLFGGILYYIIRPLVRLIEKIKVPRLWATILAIFIVLAVLLLISTYTGSIIKTQATEFAQSLPGMLNSASDKINDLLDSNLLSYFNFSDFSGKISSYIESASKSIGFFTISFLSAVTNIGSILLIIPIILFYLLKDDKKFSPGIIKFIPRKHKDNVRHMLGDIDTVLSNYIAGQLMDAFIVGILTYIGYLIIGMQYSLILAIFTMFACLVPFFGPWIGLVPAVLISLAVNPFMALKVFIVMMIVQQIDNNFISPQVMKKSMDLHPLTVILLLMGIVPIMGVVGLIIVIPLYSAIKVTISNIIEMYYPKYDDVFGVDNK